MYVPGPPPQDKDSILLYLIGELDKLANELREINPETLKFKVMHSPPAKPREGMVAYADGTDWNPGAGEGPYVYTSAGWTKL